MKIVVLDGYTENPGDISWGPLEELGEVTVYDRTSYEESPLIAERIGDAEVVVINKTPISKETMDKCPVDDPADILRSGVDKIPYIVPPRVPPSIAAVVNMIPSLLFLLITPTRARELEYHRPYATCCNI